MIDVALGEEENLLQVPRQEEDAADERLRILQPRQNAALNIATDVIAVATAQYQADVLEEHGDVVERLRPSHFPHRRALDVVAEVAR